MSGREEQMASKVVEIGCNLDWISPILAIIGDAAHGGGHTFLVPYGCGWSGREVSRLLRQRGIANWGRMVINGTLTVTVRLAQARWAQYVLDRAGVPLEGGRIEPDRAQFPRPVGRDASEPKSAGSALGDIWNQVLF